MAEDLRTFLILSGALAAYLIACLAMGGVPSKGGWVSRKADPGMYWLGITIPAAVLVMMVLAGSVWSLAQATH